jgi:hypothetical protein
MILGVNQFSGSNCCWITFCVLHLLRKCYIIEFAKLLLFLELDFCIWVNGCRLYLQFTDSETTQFFFVMTKVFAL